MPIGPLPGLFAQFAGQWRQTGRDKCAASLIVNRLRWEYGLKSKWEEFKISNNHIPMLARQLVDDDSSFRHFFNFHGDKVEAAV